MICLSKADQGSFKKMFFNQSPAPLSRENTTRQDLNGISNLREHVSAGQNSHSGSAVGAGAGAGAIGMETWSSSAGSDDEKALLAASGRGVGQSGLPSPYFEMSGGEDQHLLPMAGPLRPTRSRSVLWGWLTWTSSVVTVSLILTFSIFGFFPLSSSSSTSEQAPAQDAAPSPVPESSMASPLRRRDTCDKGGVTGDSYDTALHVGGLLIIWFVSTAGSSFALLAQRISFLRIPPKFFFVVRHFGTGVLIATAFVHLLPTAFASLNDPCLDSFFTEGYQALPGAISLASIFIVTIIEMVFHPSRQLIKPGSPSTGGGHGHGHGHGAFMPSSPVSDTGYTTSSSNEEKTKAKAGFQTKTNPSTDEIDAEMPRSPLQGMVRDFEAPKGRNSSVGHTLNHLHADGELTDGEQDRIDLERAQDGTSSELKLRKERLQVVLLEMGILFHSVFIGMSVSVAVGNDFIVLLIAIVFHQTFEGLALGSRIASVKWAEGNRQPWLMAMAYGLTTPAGQALGIATHTLYSPNSAIGLIVVGVMNSISAGLLTFASLVELLSEDFLSDDSWRTLRGSKRVVAYFIVFLGAFGMSLVGAWA